MTTRTARVEQTRTAAVLAEIVDVCSRLTDPYGSPLGRSGRQTAAGFAPAAACYASPEFAREADAEGVPLFWTWPRQAWSSGDRRNELLLAGALALAAILHEQQDSQSTAQKRPRLSLVRDHDESPIVERRPDLVDHEAVAAAAGSVAAARVELVDADGAEPTGSLRPMAVDRLALGAACYLLPEELRSDSRTGVPQMWAWPDATWIEHDDRIGELITGAAMVVATVELFDLAESFRGRTTSLAVVNGGADER